WKLLRYIIQQAATYSHVTFAQDPKLVRGVVHLIIEGPDLRAVSFREYEFQSKILTSNLLSSIAPYVVTTNSIHIDVFPKALKMRTSADVAAFEISQLKPAFRRDDTILYPEVWTTCINQNRIVSDI